MPEKPHNILILCSDEHAPQVMQHMGDPQVRTPNMDRLAARGVRFDSAYANNPICVPGRYSTLTGRYIRDIGSLQYGDGLDPATWTYPKHFSAAGWQTTCVGKQHFMGLEQMHGWQFRPYGDMELLGVRHKMPGYDRNRDPYPDPAGKGLQAWVEEAGPGRDGFIIFDESVTRETQIALQDYYLAKTIPAYDPARPLLLQVGWKTPHWPFMAPQELYDYHRQRIGPPRVPTSAEHQFPELTQEQILNARAAYWGLVEYTDQQIGKVLDCLEELGVLDDFIIIYTSDHGELAGERGRWGKGVAHEWSSRVPLIVSGPGIPQGRVVTENVSLVDLFPTLCDLAGLEPPPDLRGDSLLPLIHGAADAPTDRTVISEFFYNADGSHGWVMAKRGSHKVVRYLGLDQIEHFDLATDPDELTNLADDPEHSEIRDALLSEIDALPQPFTWAEV